MAEQEHRPGEDENQFEEESLDEMAEKMQVPSATAAGSIRFPVVEKKVEKPAETKKPTG
jgi:hypothetical protein